MNKKTVLELIFLTIIALSAITIGILRLQAKQEMRIQQAVEQAVQTCKQLEK